MTITFLLIKKQTMKNTLNKNIPILRFNLIAAVAAIIILVKQVT